MKHHYHKAFGLPQLAVNLFGQTLYLTYSEHALKAAATDRFGELPLFDEVGFIASDVFEAVYEDDNIVQAACRIPYTDTLDLVYVLCPPLPALDGRRVCLVKTMWANKATDTHKTLNRMAYERPKQVNTKRKN